MLELDFPRVLIAWLGSMKLLLDWGYSRNHPNRTGSRNACGPQSFLQPPFCSRKQVVTCFSFPLTIQVICSKLKNKKMNVSSWFQYICFTSVAAQESTEPLHLLQLCSNSWKLQVIWALGPWTGTHWSGLGQGSGKTLGKGNQSLQ